jgi:hypothetical protein
VLGTEVQNTLHYQKGVLHPMVCYHIWIFGMNEITMKYKEWFHGEVNWNYSITSGRIGKYGLLARMLCETRSGHISSMEIYNSDLTFVLYESETWCVTLRNEHRLSAYEKRGCWWQYMDLRGRDGVGGSYVMKSLIICTLHQIGSELNNGWWDGWDM